MIKPIETCYRGYRFRSRLEARWAVFFDALDIEWDYEVEGFVLSDGTLYLPDFWLPTWQLYLEVKAVEPTEEQLWKAKKMALHKEMSILVGKPWGTDDYSEYYVLSFLVLPRGDVETCHYVFMQCRRCDNVGLESYGFHYDGWQDEGFGWGFCCCERAGWVGPRLEHAYEAARGARFEHGQVGAPDDW